MIGEFEYLLLSAAARLGQDAYGAAIREDVERVTDRPCSAGALYTTIERLEQKGLLETWMGDPTSERGGRSKRMVRVTARGMRKAAAFYRTITQASEGIVWRPHAKGARS